jgi:predicted patatin/cPLA2 family phospholipase
MQYSLNKQYNTLCLGGGGISGISYVGALKYLKDNNFLDISLIENYVGASVGAMLLLLFSLNYTIDEVYDFILNFNFKTLESDINLNDIFENFGIDNGKKFNHIFYKFIKNKYDCDDLTFMELYNLTHKKLTLVGTNLSNECEDIFSCENTPNMSILVAVRISASIPIVFTPVLYNSNYYVDGGLVNNFPINLCNPDTTLGIKMINPANKLTNINSILSVFFKSIKILHKTANKNNYDLKSNNIITIVKLIASDIDYNIDYDQKNNLMINGQEYAKDFIELYNKTNNNTVDCEIQTDNEIHLGNELQTDNEIHLGNELQTDNEIRDDKNHSNQSPNLTVE